jgi:bla regulator protein blaR1
MDHPPFVGKLTLAAVYGCLLVAVTCPSFVRGQSSDASDWEKAAGGKMSFEVASVKPGMGPGPTLPIFSNFVLGYNDNKPPDGVLTATNVPLFDYIAFAYKLDLIQTRALAAQLPSWSRKEFFDIEARPQSKAVTRDQVRLMMQSLLADRFKLVAHLVSKQGPEYALVLAKVGKLGPQMRSYPDGFPCADAPQLTGGGRGQGSGVAPILPTVDDGRFPASCGRISRMTPSGPGLARQGGRDIPMGSIIGWLQMPESDRTLVDRTGLSGTFDVSVEFETTPPPGADSPAAPGNGPAFLEAMERQLGLKLQPITGPVETLIIDHVEEPSPN